MPFTATKSHHQRCASSPSSPSDSDMLAGMQPTTKRARKEDANSFVLGDPVQGGTIPFSGKSAAAFSPSTLSAAAGSSPRHAPATLIAFRRTAPTGTSTNTAAGTASIEIGASTNQHFLPIQIPPTRPNSRTEVAAAVHDQKPQEDSTSPAVLFTPAPTKTMMDF